MSWRPITEEGDALRNKELLPHRWNATDHPPIVAAVPLTAARCLSDIA
jgi:hypothetical protein